MMGKWSWWLGRSPTSNIVVNKGLLSPSVLPVTRIGLSWTEVEAEETEIYQMKCKACSGFERLKVEEF